MKSIVTFLMFVGDQAGKAEQAVELYTSVFENSEITSISRWGAEDADPEGTVKNAKFTINGREFVAMDSAAAHEFGFTPSISMFIEFDNLEEMVAAYEALSADGKELMPLGDYGFSQKFCWLNDRFGVSWQLNLQ